MLIAIRLELPDRPGMLGEVAARLGTCGVNIVTVDVIESEGGRAVDEIRVEAEPGCEESLREALEDIPEVVVERVAAIDAPHDWIASMELAARMAERPEEATEFLVRELPSVLGLSWAAAIRGPGASRVVASSPGAPHVSAISLPWMPLEEPRRLPLEPWVPSMWRSTGLAARLGLGVFELAAAPLGDGFTAVLVGRRAGPRFRALELRQLGLLARTAAALQSPPLRTGKAVSL